MQWLAIVDSFIKLLTPHAEKSLIKKLREHSDQLLAVEQKLLVANQAFLQDTDNRDDLLFVNLIQQKALLEAALARDLQLAQKQ